MMYENIVQMDMNKSIAKETYKKIVFG
jgi:hypothetical protein